MKAARTTSATTLRFLSDALDLLGADWREILRRCDIDPAWVDDPEARIPQDDFDRVWKVAGELTGDPCIGLHAGERIRPHAVNLFGYMMLSSATIGDGVDRIARYQDVLTGKAWLSIEEDGSGVHMYVGLAHEDSDIEAIHAEYVAALLIKVMSWVTEKQIVPLAVRFRHAARGDADEYTRFFCCPVRFGAHHSELLLAPGTLEIRSKHANARFARLHEQFASELLQLQEDASLTARVRLQLAESLESGPPDRSSVAKRLAMSDRSLQRRLQEEGTSFRAVVDEWRRELAREQLQRRGTPIAEVAYLTGFAEVSSFNRAVRRWFGCTPGELRLRAPFLESSQGRSSA